MDAVFINLDKRDDRRRQFERQSRVARIEVTRFPAVDGREIEVPATRGEHERGIYASMLSHKAVIELARSQGLPQILVFEDDAMFPEWFRDELEYFVSLVPDDWGLLYLGGHGWPRRWQHVRGPVLRATNVQNIEAYVVRDAYYDRIIAALEEAEPIAERWADEVLRDLQGEIPTYTMLNPLVRQSIDYSDNYGRPAQDYSSRCDIPGWFTDVEGQEYVRQVRKFAQPTVVELGTHKGRSASFVAELVKRRGGATFCVDLWNSEPSAWGDFEWWMNAAGLRHCVNTVRDDAAESARFFADGSVDVVLVDTESSYEETRRNIRAWLPKIRPGGVMLGPHYADLHGAFHGVRRAVDETFGRKPKVVDSLWVHEDVHSAQAAPGERELQFAGNETRVRRRAPSFARDDVIPRHRVPELVRGSSARWARVLTRVYDETVTCPVSVSPAQGELLRTLALNAAPAVAVEIGTFVGVSTVWIASALDELGGSAILHSVDLFAPIEVRPPFTFARLADPLGFAGEAIESAGLGRRVRLHRSDSLEFAADDESIPGGVVDFLFIDGDHTVAGCTADFFAWAPRLAVGGYLVFHDIYPEICGWNGPRHVIENYVRPDERFELLELETAPDDFGIAVARRRR